MNEMMTPVEGEQIVGAVAHMEPGESDAIDVTEDTISANATARLEYPFHDITADYDVFAKEELDAMRNSVRERGLIAQHTGLGGNNDRATCDETISA